jgi:hypothetical protein
MFIPHHQNGGQNSNIKIANESFFKCGIVQICGNDSNKSKFY